MSQVRTVSQSEVGGGQLTVERDCAAGLSDPTHHPQVTIQTSSTLMVHEDVDSSSGLSEFRSEEAS